MCKMGGDRVCDGEEYGKLKYMKCNDQLNNVDERLGYVCLRRIAHDGMHHPRGKERARKGTEDILRSENGLEHRGAAL